MTGQTTSTRVLRGLGALLLLAVLLVGIPLALWAVGGSPIPSGLPSWNEVVSALTHPDVTGSLLLGLVKIVAWLGWATFALAVILEIPAALRGVPAPQLRGFAVQQRTATALVATILAMGGLGASAVATATAAPAAAAPVATLQTVQSTTPNVNAAQAEQTSASPAPASAAERATYKVQRGDNLWSIAQDKLGDVSRYREIVELNVGVTQDDGYALEKGSDWIEPGWTLTLPIPAEKQDHGPKAHDTVRHHVVQSGESLSSIARDTLGDPERYEELLHASADTIQPDGSRLTDADLIQPGWTITIPAEADQKAPAAAKATTTTNDAKPKKEAVASADSAPADAEPRSETPVEKPVPAPAVPAPATSANTTPEPAHTAPSVAAADEVDQVADDVEDSDGIPVDARTAAGVGGLLAAGLLSLLATRRIVAQRRRRAGERITMPIASSGASALETEMRAVADPLGRETVNAALRALATWHREHGRPLPDVRAARLAPGHAFELYLGEPADLPSPWISTADRHVWQLTAEGASSPEVLEAAATGEAPWPSLVTLGHDDEDAHFMLDLEQTGCLDIRGDQVAGEATLAALAIELATSMWADDLQVTLVGTHATMPGIIDTGRIRHVSGLGNIVRELEARATDVQTALEQVGATSVPDARGRGIASDSWTPEILLIGEALDPDVRAALEQLVARVPGVGIAAVTNDANVGEWVLDLDTEIPGRGILHPAQLAIRPQQVDAETYAQAIELLAESDPHPGPAWAAGLDDTEISLDELSVTAVDAPTADEPAAVTLAIVEEPSPTANDEAKVDAVETSEASAATETSAQPDVATPDVDTVTAGEAKVVKLHPPVLRVLGEVELEVGSGVEMQDSHRTQATEVIAFLLFNPGAKGNALSAAVWPTRDENPRTRRSAVSRARRWLGTDVEGREHLPRFWTDENGDKVDHDAGGYRLRGVETDWHRFLELVGEDITTTPTDDLLTALELVRGPAFTKKARGASTRIIRYTWAEHLLHEIDASIIDVAHEVAQRALRTGDLATARRASAVGRLADPADERSWRDAIRAEWASGRIDVVERLIAGVRDHVTEKLQLDLDEETEELIAEIDELAKRATRRGSLT